MDGDAYRQDFISSPIQGESVVHLPYIPPTHTGTTQIKEICVSRRGHRRIFQLPSSPSSTSPEVPPAAPVALMCTLTGVTEATL